MLLLIIASSFEQFYVRFLVLSFWFFKVFFFLMWTILFKVFIEFVTILLLGFWQRGIWDLSSLTRDQTCPPCMGRQSLNHWTTGEVMQRFLFNINTFTTIPLHLFRMTGSFRLAEGKTL